VSFAAITLCLASHRVFIDAISLSTQSGNFWYTLVHDHRNKRQISVSKSSCIYQLQKKWHVLEA
jgi:hypothetical protein